VSYRFGVAELPYFRGPHLRIARQRCSLKPFQLTLLRRLYSGPDGLGILDLPLVGQFLIINTRDLDVDIDAIQQRPTDFLLVASDGHSRTTTLLD
jgi:hypothetical protein